MDTRTMGYVLSEDNDTGCTYFEDGMENLADVIFTMLMDVGDGGDPNSIDLPSLLRFKNYLKSIGDNEFYWTEESNINRFDFIRRKMCEYNREMIISESVDESTDDEKFSCLVRNSIETPVKLYDDYNSIYVASGESLLIKLKDLTDATLNGDDDRNIWKLI